MQDVFILGDNGLGLCIGIMYWNYTLQLRPFGSIIYYTSVITPGYVPMIMQLLRYKIYHNTTTKIRKIIIYEEKR